MTKISGIFAATMSVINSDLSLNVEKTINHAEMLIDQGCHGTAIFGSTGQSQLIPVSEKIDLLTKLSKSKHKDKHLIGTGLNSLGETINFMRVANSLKFKKFLIMPPAYYKYGDTEVIEFYSKIIQAIPECEIILYNFEKLSGYKFSVECVIELVKKFPEQIIGVKDRPGVAASIFKPLSQNFINVDMVVQNISLNGKETDLTFTIKSEDIKKTEKLINSNKKISFRKLTCDNDVSKVSIIGVGMITTPGITYRMFQALAAKKINIMVISTSEIKISVLISSKLVKKAIAALHKEFKLD